MNQRLFQWLALVTLGVTLGVMATGVARANAANLTPQAYLPLVERASSAADAAWSLFGNAGTNPAVNFVGTTDGASLILQPGLGNVGIGTKSPVSKLHVTSSDGALPPRLEATGNSFAAGWDFYRGATGKGYVGVPPEGQALAPNEMVLFGGSDTKASIWAGQARGLTVDTNTNVGVGTDAPSNKLTVDLGSGAAADSGVTIQGATATLGDLGLRIRNTAAGGREWYLDSTSNGSGYGGGRLVVLGGVGDVPVMTLLGNGRVGIGETTPAGRLEVAGPDTAAIYGMSTGANGTGLYGVASNGPAAYGVWGTSTSGYAGFFSGNVRVTGNLEKGGGSFKIDHPLDPANKYLSHSFVESPDMKNIYDGVVALDGSGEAVVTMPDWFDALNQDFRYQLTAIGAPGPNLYVAEEVHDNRFKIAGGKPGMKVSWQVTGTRHDAWANAHRIPVEEDKLGAEQGSYLHPELFGQPQTKSVEWATHPELMQQLQAANKQP
ncbi:MAG: hypothetical protein U0822_04605 [Anaerolineae bacterium]